jgi:PTH1 family peptidyl-tRNA hydrolase
LENILVIVDDLALPVGALRLKGQGSDGGHNGLKHIAATLGTTNYARLRFGIGNDFGKGHQVNFVLGAFDSEEQKVIEQQLDTTSEIIRSFCYSGLARTMNQFNKKGNGKAGNNE